MTIKLDLTGHIALVTGASRGIGAAIAIAFAEAGAAVAVNYRERADDAETVVEKIKDMGAKGVLEIVDARNKMTKDRDDLLSKCQGHAHLEGFKIGEVAVTLQQAELLAD